MINSYNVNFKDNDHVVSAKSDYYYYDIDKETFSIEYCAGSEEWFLSKSNSLENAKSIVRLHIELINLNKATELKHRKKLNEELASHRLAFESIIDKYR